MNKKMMIVIGAVVAVLIVSGIGAVLWGRSHQAGEITSDSDTNLVQEATEQETLPEEQMESFQDAIDQTIKPEETQEEVPLFLESLRDAYSLEIVSIYPLEAKDTYQ